MREEEEEQSEYTRRYSSTTSPTVGHACFKYKHPLFQLILQSIALLTYQGPRRGATPEEDLRRMHVREEEVYRGNRLAD